MSSIHKLFSVLIAGTILVNLGSCSSPPTDQGNNNGSLPTSSPVPASPIPSTVNQTTPIPVAKASAEKTPEKTPQTAGTTTETPKSTTTVTIFKADDQCQNLIPEQVTVSADRPIAEAVNKVLIKQNIKGLEIASQEINVDFDKQTAIVDLRLSPNSKRDFGSISSCQRFALFGSLRQTLTNNAKWKIKTVKFTYQGKEIE